MDVLVQAHKHMSEFEDQDDFDNAFCKLHRERNQTILQFANVARAAYLRTPIAWPYEGYDHPQASQDSRTPGRPHHGQPNGSRNFSDLLEAIQALARRPMSQTSSSYPSFNDDWTDSTYVTEYYYMDDYHDTEDGGKEDEYNEFEDYDGKWSDMSDIPEDLTFEEPELACILENLQNGRKGSGNFHRKGKKGFGKGKFRDKEGGKDNRPENYKQVRLKLQGDRLNRGWRDQPTRATYKGRNRPQFAQVDDLLTRTRCFKCGELEHLARN